jgi:predicted ATPase/signal transduction histidine kinase/tRNA A-37 threonylcarbamoyl transferase component Bud32
MNLLEKATLIAEGFNSRIYHLADSPYEQEVILKVIKEDFNYFPHSSRLFNEHKYIDQINIKGVRKSLDLVEDHETPILVLEFFDGKTVKELIKTNSLSFIDRLKIAIRIVEALHELHANKHIIHRDISAYNILVNEHYDVSIIDLGLASNIDIKQSIQGVNEQLEGTLPYISPEQTGRVNQVVDSRSDLYSLGAVLYELFTGQLPFHQTDPLELIHAHLALAPTPPSAINAEIPQVFSDILLKLLSKNGEHRYQSALGLLDDLKKCQDQVALKVEIKNFDLGQNDLLGKFVIPSKLYGRDEHKKKLLDSINRIGSDQKGITWVTGVSGTGKTSLVYEIYKPLTEKRGHFIRGKHQQFQRDRPYQAIIQAINGLINLLLSESDERLSKWRTEISEALGDQGKLITDLAPNLELIIGKQKELPILGINESQNRFAYIFTKFILALANENHPLIMFIDDLQWADTASLKLLKTMVINSEIKHFHFIGAYRNNEVSDSHPLNIIFHDLPDYGVAIDRVHLEDLTLEDTADLIADTLLSDRKTTLELANIVHTKTAGNPFFVNEFLKSIHEKELVKFRQPTKDSPRGSWRWDIQDLKATTFTDNVVAFMVEKLRKISPATQRLLTLGACIGDRFDLNTLQVIYGKENGNVQDDIWQAVMEQILLVEENYGEMYHAQVRDTNEQFQGLEFRFAHDRVRQAAYELIPESEKAEAHQRIGELLLEKVDLDKEPEQVFDVLTQLNKGLPHEQSAAFKHKVIQLNLLAGTKSMTSTAYEAANSHFQLAIDLTEEDDWKSNYEDVFLIHLSAMECHYIQGQYKEMTAIGHLLKAKAKSKLDKLKTENIFVQALIAQSKHLELIDYGLDILKKAGIRLPKKPQDFHILSGLVQTKLKLRNKSFEALEQLPAMEDQKLALAIKMMSAISTAAYHNFPKLFPLVIFKSVQISIKNGNCIDSISFYGGYGTILCGVLGQYDAGYPFGKLSLALLEKSGTEIVAPKTLVIFYTFINHWKNHVRSGIEPIEEAYLKGLDIGDAQYAASAGFIRLLLNFLTGVNLTNLVPETQHYLDKMATLNQESYHLYMKIVYQGLIKIFQDSDDPTALEGDIFSSKAFFGKEYKEEFQKDGTALFHIAFNGLLLNFLFDNPLEGVKHADEARSHLDVVVSTAYVPVFHFYDSLVKLKVIRHADKATQRKWMKTILANQKKMKTWAKHSPTNYQHKFDLVEAELMALNNKLAEAERLYKKSIEAADEQQYVNEQAVACELAGRYYARHGNKAAMTNHIEEAIRLYRRWGAHAKVKQLKTEFPAQEKKSLSTTATTYSFGTFGSMSGTASLDMATVLKAATAISGEIQLSKAIPSLLKIVVENAGAQAGSLLLIEDSLQEEKGTDSLILHAQCTAGENAVMTDPIPVESTDLPKSIIQYVLRSREAVILNDAQNEDQFAKDPIIEANGVLSILCLPVVHHGALLAIIYLENNLSKGAFTTQRTDLISMLSGQIAITLHNALLYDMLEHKVAERTKEIQQQKNQLDNQNTRLTHLNSEKDYLISIVSHDLRNPLYLIRGYIDMIKQKPDSEEMNTFLSRIAESSDRMESMITHILDVNSINSGEIKLNVENFDVPSVIAEAIDNFKSTAEKKNIKLFSNFKLETLDVSLDLSHFRQIIDNLLSNAIKYTPESGDVEVKLDLNDGGELQIAVTDTGQGLSKRDQKLLFQKFQPLTSKPTGDETSTGLGLSIVKRYVDAMKGNIWCESELKKGSTFFVTLPRSI